MQNPESFDEHIDVARRGGSVAREARLRLEEETGRPVVTPLNVKDVTELQGGSGEQEETEGEEAE